MLTRIEKYKELRQSIKKENQQIDMPKITYFDYWLSRIREENGEIGIYIFYIDVALIILFTIIGLIY